MSTEVVMNKLIGCLMLLWLIPAHTGSLNPVMPVSPDVQLGATTPALTTEYLVYEQVEGQNKRVWSHHLTEKTQTDLMINNPLELISLGEQVLIITTSDSGPYDYEVFDVYRTDGSAEGTTFVHSFANEYRLEVTNHGVFIITFEDIFQHQGEQWIHHELDGNTGINHLGASDFCQLNEERFIFLGGGTYVAFGQVYPSQDLNVHSNFDLFVPLNCERDECDITLEQIGAYCIISQTSPSGFQSFQFLVNQTPQALNYSGGRDVSQYRSFAWLNNQLIGLWGEERAGAFSLHHLNPDTFEVIKQTTHSLPEGITLVSGFNPRLVSAGDHLMVAYDQTYWFDQSLEHLPPPDDRETWDVFLLQQSEVFSQSASTLVISPCPWYYCWDEADGPQLVSLAQPHQPRVFVSNHEQNLSVIDHNPLTGDTLLTLTDLATEQPGIYQLAEQPNIGRQTNGIWYNPELPSQGLSINFGVRQNGSQYLFISTYVFEQGQPLWLAGVVDVDGTEPMITMDLYRYDGPGLFEPGQAASQAEFATLQLQMPSCNALSAVLSVGQTNHPLTLYRANDVRADRWCQD
jgi:hypothetical protein